jgi:hypothetical protein
MPSNPEIADADFVSKARELYQRDGEVEVDEGAEVSRNHEPGDSNGAYVAAWVWVANSEFDDSDEGDASEQG